jgi:ABC-type antimicrobial peptide transport system permease subunit
MLARLPAFKEKLLQTPGVQSVTFTTDAPSSENNWSSNFAFNHKEDEKFQVSLKFADEDYFKTFGLQFLAGRPYRKSDTTYEIVINETLTHKLGVQNANDIIGKDIRLGQSEWKKIVGVVKDFKTNSLRENIKPLLIAENKQFYGLTAVKMNSSNIHQTQENIQSAWNQYFPEYAFTGSFLDENIAKFYEQEKQLELLYKIFAGLAIFISCLGLYGLVSFMAVRRTKEIGIRKVLGASVGNIILLFSKEFTILIAVAFVIAAPVAYFIMHAWLNNFVFRINMGVDVFLLAIFISVIIAWISVGYKAIKAALANPVKSLGVE